MAIPAPVIKEEMVEWVALGGGNSGIAADNYTNHPSGFHRAANEVPSTDYSRRRDPNGADGPFVDWRYASAGDFHHGGEESLRVHHRRVLSELMAGKYPMICEFIGKPWADKPVYYWARWNGIKTLKLYTGPGHDKWSHISWYRSRVNQRANLWTPTIPQGGLLMSLPLRKGDKGEDVHSLQYQLNILGFSVGKQDGEYGDKTSAGVLAMRKSLGSSATSGDVFTGTAHGQLVLCMAQKFGGGKEGPKGKDGTNGKDGLNGKDGKDGRDGMLILPERVLIEATVKPAG